METTKMKVLAVDDAPASLTTVRDRLRIQCNQRNIDFELTEFTSFDEAESAYRSGVYDLAILDLRNDNSSPRPVNDRGLDLFLSMRQWDFVPTIFYTAYAEDITQGELSDDLVDLRFVSVAPKDKVKDLDAEISYMLDSNVIGLVNSLRNTLNRELSDFMWSLHGRPSASTDPELKVNAVRRIAARFDHESRVDGHEGTYPSRMYLVPPVVEDLELGSLLRKGDDWWVVGSPACDLALQPPKKNGERVRKAQYVKLFHAKPLSDVGYKAANLATGAVPRYFWLPPFAGIPEMAIDFQEVTTVEFNLIVDSEVWEKGIATLDNPFAEGMLIRYANYSGRIGLPAIPVE